MLQIFMSRVIFEMAIRAIHNINEDDKNVEKVEITKNSRWKIVPTSFSERIGIRDITVVAGHRISRRKKIDYRNHILPAQNTRI